MDIKSMRQKICMTQKDFANFFGIPLRTIQKWEQRDSEPAPYLLELMQKRVEVESFCDVTKYRLSPRNNYPVVAGVQFKNANKINPIQQKAVFEIVKHLSQDVNVRKIVVFGSSTLDRCNYDSDVDVYVELRKHEKIARSFQINKPIDLWSNFDIDPVMLEEVKTKGVVVYDC